MALPLRVIVKPVHAGERLDRFLTRQLTGFSRKKVKALLDAGQVTLNDRRVVIASWALQAGDRVAVLPAGERPPDRDYFLKVVYEDDALLVVEKDAGILCEASPQATAPTLVAIVNQYLKRKFAGHRYHYVGLVHRLDKDTSGLMVYTKTKEANRITDQFKRHTIERRYLALVAGRVEREHGRIEGYLTKDLLKGGAKVRAATEATGKRAVTSYRVVERYADATLLELALNTGRTHQIRVQLAGLGHPVLGDKIYAAAGRRAVVGLSPKRQALHASYLAFHHPLTGEPLEFSSPLPRELRRLVERLRLRA